MIKRYGFISLRYIVTVCILIYLILTALFAGGSTRSFDEVAAAMDAALQESSLKPVDDLGFRRRYGYSVTDFEGVKLYANEFRLSADEILLVKANSFEQLAEFRAVLEARLQTRQQDFEGFSTEQAYAIEQAILTIRGLYLFLGIGPYAEDMNQVFLQSL